MKKFVALYENRIIDIDLAETKPYYPPVYNFETLEGTDVIVLETLQENVEIGMTKYGDDEYDWHRPTREEVRLQRKQAYAIMDKREDGTPLIPSTGESIDESTQVVLPAYALVDKAKGSKKADVLALEIVEAREYINGIYPYPEEE